MTESDIASIEETPAVELPEVYRRRLVPYPVPALRGNSDTELWDDPTLLTRRNRELRAGEHGFGDPWPGHLVAIGQVLGDPSIFAIDLRDPDAPGWWVDHGDATADSSGETYASRESWLDEMLPHLEGNVTELGVRPDADPSEVARAEVREGRSAILFLVGMIVVISLLLFVFAAFIGS